MRSLKDMFDIDKSDDQFIVALAGNPNTGKSTVFNYLAGLKQHTGNWPGKTVATARGDFKYNDSNYALIDLPGTYSLFALSQEEIVARDFICFGKPDLVIVVCDATSLERNLNLAFQVMELTNNIILCVNLVDEAEKKGITIDNEKLEESLGIPVVLTAARSGRGMDDLLNALDLVSSDNYKFNNKPVFYDNNIEIVADSFKSELENIIDFINPRWLALRLIDEDKSIFDSMYNYIDESYIDDLYKIKEKFPKTLDKERIRDNFTKTNYDYAKNLSENVCIIDNNSKLDRDDKLDKILTSKHFGMPIMLLLLVAILWISIISYII